MVGVPGIRIDLNGHRITSPAVDSTSIPTTPGSAGIRNPGYPRVRIEDSQRRGWIAGFEASVLLTDANRKTVTGLDSYDSITLVRSHNVAITNSYLTSDWLGVIR